MIRYQDPGRAEARKSERAAKVLQVSTGRERLCKLAAIGPVDVGVQVKGEGDGMACKGWPHAAMWSGWKLGKG